MKKFIAAILLLTMILSMSFSLSACNNKDEEDKNEQGMAVVDSEPGAEDDAEDTDGTEEPADADVITSFEPDAPDTLGHDLPLEIEKIELLKDGTVILTPTGDLKENELQGSEATSLMPFADSGDAKVKELYLFRIGNGGYRAIVALMDNGTVSAINPSALIEDHIIAVKDNLGGRDSFTGVEQEEGEDAFSIIGKTEEGDDVVLDPVILDEDGEIQPAE